MLKGKGNKMKLLSTANTKTLKSLDKGYLTYILHLAPYNLSGVNVCPKASQGCAASCLNLSGMGIFKNVQLARLNKTKMYLNQRDEFIAQLKKEIVAAQRKAKKLNLKLCIRLNGTSDIVWEKVTDILQSFPEVQFYDYTKIAKRFLFKLPENYHLTFSLAEDNENDAMMVLRNGGNVAAVFREKLPETYMGFNVINGDESDLRFTDSTNVIVGLLAKGKAKKDTTGFVKE